MSYRPHHISVDVCWYYSIAVFGKTYLFGHLFKTKRTMKFKSLKDSLNALECRLTGFKMDEIIHEDFQVSGGLFDKRSSTFGMYL